MVPAEHWGMSMPADPQPQTRLFTLAGGQFGQTGFDTALRGYDRAQVDGYVARVEHAMAAVAARADAAERRLADLAEALNAANAERVRLRADRSTAPEVHLGARLEQIMRLAEEQAEEIEAAARDRARQIVADAEREADRMRADVRTELATLSDRRRVARAALSRVNGEVARLAALAESTTDAAPTGVAPTDAAPAGVVPAAVVPPPDRVATQRIVISDVPTQRIGIHDKAVEPEPVDEPTRPLTPVPVLPRKRRKRRARR
jgi:DivIVA domain-containing protein